MPGLQNVRARALIAADRTADERARSVGRELRQLREDSGLGLRAVAKAAGVSVAQVSRIEGGTTDASRRALTRIAAILGADISERVFPRTGPRIRDRHQARILEALLEILHPRWTRRLEQPVYRPVRGVIDLVIAEAAQLVAAEIESTIRRLEQHIRWSHLKADGLANLELDSGQGIRAPAIEVSRLLVLRSTSAHRELGRRFSETLRVEFPARAADAYAALTGVAAWPGPALLWATVEGTRATILDRPPRGIDVGR